MLREYGKWKQKRENTWGATARIKWGTMEAGGIKTIL
jgi:hypothetical protein